MCDLHIILCRRPSLRGTSLLGDVCKLMHSMAWVTPYCAPLQCRTHLGTWH